MIVKLQQDALDGFFFLARGSRCFSAVGEVVDGDSGSSGTIFGWFAMPLGCDDGYLRLGHTWGR